MYRVHNLPTNVVKNRVEEEPNDEIKPLNSIDDSLVLLQALRQSRQTWLTSAFAKFSTRSRSGKSAEIWQPPHTLRFRGKCDIEIGPHVFYATSVYEVTYHPYSVTPNAISPNTLGSLSQQSPPVTSNSSSSSNHLCITNELIAQVNVAAQTNPTLANLIAVAASGSATAEQLHSLGVTLQSLAGSNDTVISTSCSTDTLPPKAGVAVPSPLPTSPNKTSLGTMQPENPPVLSLRPSQTPIGSTLYQTSSSVQLPAKESDVLIEFYENSTDRWILPKELVVYEKLTRWDGVNSFADIIFSTIFPFEHVISQITSSNSLDKDHCPPTLDVIHPITLRFFNVPISIWNLFASAAADEDRTKRVRTAIDAMLNKAASRVYLQHRIPDGPLLSQLQASTSDRYPMKGIKTNATMGGSGQSRRRSSALATKGGSLSVPKRKRPAQNKKLESRTGTCVLCKRASIVLAPDSDFCPPCKKKVLAGEVVPPNPDSLSASALGQSGNSVENVRSSKQALPNTSAKEDGQIGPSMSDKPQIQNDSTRQSSYMHHWHQTPLPGNTTGVEASDSNLEPQVVHNLKPGNSTL